LTPTARGGEHALVPKVQANGIEIEYDELGEPDGPPLLLISGLGGQLISWPPNLIEQLAGHGYRIILYDNRDAGLSTHLDAAGFPNIIGMLARMPGAEPPYTLVDMADDAAGLLDALGIERSHIFGISMGGMIAQEFAIRYPERTLSLCSVMSRSGEPGTGMPTNEGMQALLRPPARTRDQAIAQSMDARRTIRSPDFAFDEEFELSRATAAYDRAYSPAGTSRQLGAIISQRDRTEDLGSLSSFPTLVVHGSRDPLVQPDGGVATANAIPGAQLLMIEGMGHDLPAEALDEIVDALAAHIAKAEASSDASAQS
jgi:pimeloyl-ACP methyl ester carboxylesterase